MRRLLPMVALMGCTDIELSQEWQLDRTRVLAVQAEPAEPTDGDTVTLEALVYTPDGEAELTWSSDVFGGVFAEPGDEATFTIPPGTLASLPPELLAEGLSLPIEVEAATDDDVERAIKYLPVSLADTPNHNPDIGRLEQDGVRIEPGDPLVLATGASVELRAVAGEDALETYTYVNSDGVAEERTEDPYFRWYVSLGDIFPSGDGFDFDGNNGTQTFVAPDEAGSGVLYAVMLDFRGGMAWYELELTID